MNNKIKISVIIPVYNAEKYLKECIDSVLNQIYKNFELIIINDGSTDNSEKIVKEYNDNRIIYISRENKGPLETRIEGINKSTGEYILFIDADDYINDDTLLIYINKLNEKKYDIIRGNYTKVIGNKKKKIFDFKKELEYNKNNIDAIISRMAKSEKYNSLWREIIRKDIIDTNKMITTSFVGEDLLFNYQVYKKINSIKIITDSLYNYRINPASITNVTSTDKLIKNTNDILFILDNIINDLKVKKLKLEWNEKYIKQVNHSLYKVIKSSNETEKIFNYVNEVFNNERLKVIRKESKLKDYKSIEYIFYRLIYLNKPKSYIRFIKLLPKIQ